MEHRLGNLHIETDAIFSAIKTTNALLKEAKSLYERNHQSDKTEERLQRLYQQGASILSAIYANNQLAKETKEAYERNQESFKRVLVPIYPQASPSSRTLLSIGPYTVLTEIQRFAYSEFSKLFQGVHSTQIKIVARFIDNGDITSQHRVPPEMNVTDGNLSRVVRYIAQRKAADMLVCKL